MEIPVFCNEIENKTKTIANDIFELKYFVKSSHVGNKEFSASFCEQLDAVIELLYCSADMIFAELDR